MSLEHDTPSHHLADTGERLQLFGKQQADSRTSSNDYSAKTKPHYSKDNGDHTQQSTYQELLKILACSFTV